MIAVGDRVTVLFAPGLGHKPFEVDGTVLANEPLTVAELEARVPGSGLLGPRPYRWRVRLDGGEVVGGLRPGDLWLAE